MNERIGLRVTQVDIVFWCVLLDERVLKKQCFGLAWCNNKIQITGSVNKGPGLGIMDGFGEITRDPLLQVPGFANIDDSATGVLIQVTPGFIRKQGCIDHSW